MNSNRIWFCNSLHRWRNFLGVVILENFGFVHAHIVTLKQILKSKSQHETYIKKESDRGFKIPISLDQSLSGYFITDSADLLELIYDVLLTVRRFYIHVVEIL
jgi:hypothetical protein